MDGEQKTDLTRLRKLADGAFLVLNPDLTIAEVSDDYLKATMTDRSIVGKGLFEVFPDKPGDPAADGVRNLSASLDRVKATKRLDSMPIQRYPIRRPDGSWEERSWKPVNSPVLDPVTGDLAYIIHGVDDVTQAQSGLKAWVYRPGAAISIPIGVIVIAVIAALSGSSYDALRWVVMAEGAVVGALYAFAIATGVRILWRAHTRLPEPIWLLRAGTIGGYLGVMALLAVAIADIHGRLGMPHVTTVPTVVTQLGLILLVIGWKTTEAGMAGNNRYRAMKAQAEARG